MKHSVVNFIKQYELRDIDMFTTQPSCIVPAVTMNGKCLEFPDNHYLLFPKYPYYREIEILEEDGKNIAVIKTDCNPHRMPSDDILTLRNSYREFMNCFNLKSTHFYGNDIHSTYCDSDFVTCRFYMTVRNIEDNKVYVTASKTSITDDGLHTEYRISFEPTSVVEFYTTLQDHFDIDEYLTSFIREVEYEIKPTYEEQLYQQAESLLTHITDSELEILYTEHPNLFQVVTHPLIGNEALKDAEILKEVISLFRQTINKRDEKKIKLKKAITSVHNQIQKAINTGKITSDQYDDIFEMLDSITE